MQRCQCSKQNIKIEQFAVKPSNLLLTLKSRYIDKAGYLLIHAHRLS